MIGFFLFIFASPGGGMLKLLYTQGWLLMLVGMGHRSFLHAFDSGG